MSIHRRNFLVGGTGFLLAGCQQTAQTTTDLGVTGGYQDVGIGWRKPVTRPTPGSGHAYIPRHPVPTPQPDLPDASADPSTFQYIARTQWTRVGQKSNINPMLGIQRLTIHHEGFPEAVHFSDYRTTAMRLEKIRRSHRGRGWADIGYHFVVDRAGRIWEGRPARYQGAHVRNNNSHNLGIMVLGNFNLQSPSDAQLHSLQIAVRSLRRRYRITTRSIYTHRELNPTSCPGNHLQPRVASMRSNGYFA